MTQPQSTEWIHRLTREDICQYADLPQERAREFFIGRADSTSPSFNSEQSDISGRLEGLLKLFDIGVTVWQGHVLHAEGTYGTALGLVGERDYESLDIKRLARGKSIGEFVIDQAYWAIPFESDDDQTGRFTLGLGLAKDLVANLRANGEQLITRYYIDPSTYERLDGPEDELEERLMRDEIGSDRDVGYAVNYSVVFSKENTN